MNKLRFGILGTADIARKNWKGIRNSGNATVVAVASRDLGRCERFVANCQASAPMGNAVASFGSYEELIGAEDVDAVYVPLPTGLRKEWVIRAAKAGKHVVCEKPCASSAADLREMIEACRKHRVQFMDGVMFMHSRRLEAMRGEIESKGFGGLKRITSAFSFFGGKEFYASNIRADRKLEPFGCLGDLGWYCIRLSLWAMEERLPVSVTGRILREFRGIPTEFSGELIFRGGVSASIYCSFDTATEQWAIIAGSQASIRLPDFVLPFFGDTIKFETFASDLAKIGCDFNMEPRRRTVETAEYSNGQESSQETNLFRDFAAQVQSGKLNREWPEIALKTQRVMEACLKSARGGGSQQAV